MARGRKVRSESISRRHGRDGLTRSLVARLNSEPSRGICSGADEIDNRALLFMADAISYSVIVVQVNCTFYV